MRGMTRDEVQKLLGAPPSDYLFSSVPDPIAVRRCGDSKHWRADSLESHTLFKMNAA